MHYLSIGAMFRNENSWLDEWICYHEAAGVEHFFLYNHDEDTTVSDRILRPYVDKGLVDNIHVADVVRQETIPQRRRMNAIYREIFKNTSGKTQWIAMIDLDEFILPRRCDDIRQVLEQYEEFSGLAVNWASFGTGGHLRRPPTQINHLLRRGPQDWEWNRYVKSIVRPERVDLEKLYDVHHFPCREGITVDENRRQVKWMRHDISTETIRLNHYLLRSWQDFWEVKAARPRYNGAVPCDETYFNMYDRNEVFDDEIAQRFGKTIEE